MQVFIFYFLQAYHKGRGDHFELCFGISLQYNREEGEKAENKYSCRQEMAMCFCLCTGILFFNLANEFTDRGTRFFSADRSKEYVHFTVI